jgi:hypothetical protein
MRPLVPAATFLPIDWSAWPNGLRGSKTPYWKNNRRFIALPA